MSFTELEIAKRLMQDSPLNWLQWLSEVVSIEWTPTGNEPDVVKAIVMNQVLCSQLELQQKALSLLLAKKEKIILKPLLSRFSVAILLQMCVDHYNTVELSNNVKAELIYNDKNLPQIVVTSTRTLSDKEVESFF